MAKKRYHRNKPYIFLRCLSVLNTFFNIFFYYQNFVLGFDLIGTSQTAKTHLCNSFLIYFWLKNKKMPSSFTNHNHLYKTFSINKKTKSLAQFWHNPKLNLNFHSHNTHFKPLIRELRFKFEQFNTTLYYLIRFYLIQFYAISKTLIWS